MANLHNPPPTLAVAIVVDSSTTLSHEWHRIFNEYFPQLLRRLAGDNPVALTVELFYYLAYGSILKPSRLFAWVLSLTEPRIAVALPFSKNATSLQACSMS